MTAAARLWRTPNHVDVVKTLGSIRRGGGDPAVRTGPGGSIWWVTSTPDGVGTLRLEPQPAAAAIWGTAWGDGAGWLLHQMPQLLGEGDDARGFEPRHPVVARAWRRHQDWRVPRTGRAFDACVGAVIEQKVTGIEARQAWRLLLAEFGEAAPGPAPPAMRAVPTPKVWRQIPDWKFRGVGVTPQRVNAIRAIAVAAAAIERSLDTCPAESDRILQALPGIGRWTSAETRQRAHGDADAVSYGDFHVAKDICWWLTGARGSDDDLTRLLEPYAGHRYRVQRLMELERVSAPRRGPRLAPSPHRFG